MKDDKPVLDEAVDYIQFQFTTIFGDLKVVEFPAKIWDEMCGGDRCRWLLTQVPQD
jgi:hypothetical protein